MVNEDIMLWAGFILFILAMLALDLGVFQRKAHVIKMKEALGWFAFWVSLALVFNLGIIFFHQRGSEAGLEFFTAFLVEKSLSVDNIFVFILIFHYFNVPPVYQHKVLFWGIVGAIIMRAVFILAGLAILARFHWSIYFFGAFLLLTGIHMMFKKSEEYDPKRNWVMQLFKRLLPVSGRYDGNRFITRKNGRLFITPLFIVLLAVETSDIIFAVDSIPAVFAVSSDPFIVYTSNIFAILGLRSLYFAIAGFINTFYFLHYGFASIIIILGIKMLLSDIYHVPIVVSLSLIIFILLICVIVSLLLPRKTDLKMLFERFEHLNLISFRRLLMLENVIDLGEIKVKDSMQPKELVIMINLNESWEKNKKLIGDTCFSRYPLVEKDNDYPAGVVHLKSLLFLKDKEITKEYLTELAKSNLVVIHEDVLLEDALTKFQHSYENLAIVVDKKGNWTGILSIEDVLEEIVGRMSDEFDIARSGECILLSEALSPGRVVFNVEADFMGKAICNIINHIPANEFPINRRSILNVFLKGNHKSIFIVNGLAITHARIKGLRKPILVFARSDEGVLLEGTTKRAELIFILLIPYGMAHIQAKFLADIIGLKDSDYVMERLRKANSPVEIIEVIRAGEQIILD